MGVSLNIVEQKFFDQFRNGVDFTDNPSQFTPNLAGSVLEKIKVVRSIDVSWFAQSSQSDVWNINASESSIERVSGNFRQDGFSSGDVADFISGFTTSPVVEVNITIGSISQDGKKLFYTINSGSFNQSTYTNAGIRGLTELTAINYRFGLIDNDEINVDTISKVTNNDQGYYASSVGFDGGGGRDTNFVDMDVLGQYNGFVTGSARIRYVSNPSTYVQRFEIEHEFKINPYYLEGQSSNLKNRIIPNDLKGQKSYKYVIKADFLSSISNPNSKKTIENNVDLGSVAWFGENFNGYKSGYRVNSVSYADANTLDSADGILASSKTTVTIDVEALNRNFSVGERMGVYLFYLAEESEYQGTSTDMSYNFIEDRAISNSGLAPIDGESYITNLVIGSPAGSLITISFDVEYINAQKSRVMQKISQNPEFLIGVQMGDVTLDSPNSDKVIEIADVNIYDDSADIDGLMDVTELTHFHHDKQIGVDTGSTDGRFWNTDGYAVRFRFNLLKPQQAFINSLMFKLIAYNPTTKDFFDLDSYSFSLGNIIQSNVQIFSENTTRAYTLASGDQFNRVELNTEPITIALEQFYNGVIGQKIKWQEWVSNPGVDDIFFDPNVINNNKNLKSSNYADKEGYEIRSAIFANVFGFGVNGNSGLTDYLFISPRLSVFDYGEDGNLSPVLSGTIETFHPTTGVNLNGAVLSGIDTIVVSTWSSSVGAITDVTEYWGIHRIQELDSPGDDIEELSSINPFPLGNKLIPIIGETQLFLEANSGNLIATCRTDGSTIDNGKNYTIYSRLNDNEVEVTGKLTEGGDLKETEGSEVKIREDI